MRFGVKRDFASGNGHFESAFAVAELVVRAGREEPSVVVEDAGVGRVQLENTFVNLGGFFPMAEHKFHIGEGSEEIERFRFLFKFGVQHFQRGLVKALFGGRVSDLSGGVVFVFDVASQLFENANRVVVFLHLEVNNAFKSGRRRDFHSLAQRLVDVGERFVVIFRLEVKNGAEVVKSGRVELFDQFREVFDRFVVFAERGQKLAFFDLNEDIVAGVFRRFVEEGARFVDFPGFGENIRFKFFEIDVFRFEFEGFVDLRERGVGAVGGEVLRGESRADFGGFRGEFETFFEERKRFARRGFEFGAEKERERFRFGFKIGRRERGVERFFRVVGFVGER